jgi:hypothetical protein
MKISSNLSVVLTNEINISDDDENSTILKVDDDEISDDEQRYENF